MAKFTVMFKMPDAAGDAIRDAIKDGILKPEEEQEAQEVCRKFIEYGEYTYLEIDTKKRTAKVLGVKAE